MLFRSIKSSEELVRKLRLLDAKLEALTNTEEELMRQVQHLSGLVELLITQLEAVEK